MTRLLTKAERLARLVSTTNSTPMHVDPSPLNDDDVLKGITDRIGKVDFADCGGKADDVTKCVANRTAFIRAMLVASLVGMGIWFGPGRWHMAPIDQATSIDLDFSGAPAAWIVGHEGFDVGDQAKAMVRIDSGSSGAQITWRNIHLDAINRSYSPTIASGSGLNLFKAGGFTVADSIFKAGDSYRSLRGDSGFVPNQCGPGLVQNCTFIGWCDKGVYATGGPLTGAADDHGDWHIDHCTFIRCNTAASATREARRFKVTNNSVIECALGFGRTEAGDGTPTGFVAPAREMIAIGNSFYRLGSRAFRLHAEGGDVVMANEITDFGYWLDTDGVTWVPVATSARHAMRIEGASFVKVIGNTFRMKDWSSTTSHQGINIRNYTLTPQGSDTPVTWYPKGYTIRDNSFEGLPNGIGIYETGDDCHGFTDNTYDNVGTPVYGPESNTEHVIRSPLGPHYTVRKGILYEGAWVPTIAVAGVPDATVTYHADPTRRAALHSRHGTRCGVDFKVTATITMPVRTVGTGSISGNIFTPATLSSGAWAVGTRLVGTGLDRRTILVADNLDGTFTTSGPSQSLSTRAITAYAYGQIRVTGLAWPAQSGGPNFQGTPGICLNILRPDDALTFVTNIPAGANYVRFWLGLGEDRLFDTIDLTDDGMPLRIEGSCDYVVAA